MFKSSKKKHVTFYESESEEDSINITRKDRALMRKIQGRYWKIIYLKNTSI